MFSCGVGWIDSSPRYAKRVRRMFVRMEDAAFLRTVGFEAANEKDEEAPKFRVPRFPDRNVVPTERELALPISRNDGSNIDTRDKCVILIIVIASFKSDIQNET